MAAAKAAAKPMTKGQLAAHLAEKFGVSKKVGATMLDEFAALAVVERELVQIALHLKGRRGDFTVANSPFKIVTRFGYPIGQIIADACRINLRQFSLDIQKPRLLADGNGRWLSAQA